MRLSKGSVYHTLRANFWGLIWVSVCAWTVVHFQGFLLKPVDLILKDTIINGPEEPVRIGQHNPGQCLASFQVRQRIGSSWSVQISSFIDPDPSFAGPVVNRSGLAALVP